MYKWYGHHPRAGYGHPYCAATHMPQQPYPVDYEAYYAQMAGQAYDPAQAAQNNSSGTPWTSDKFIRGALIGAAAAYVLTNENVQHSVIKGTVKAWNMVQCGVEEVKERFRDAEAEILAEEAMADE